MSIEKQLDCDFPKNNNLFFFKFTFKYYTSKIDFKNNTCLNG